MIWTMTTRIPDVYKRQEVVYTPRALDEISVEIAEVNRPGLFLAGYYDYFDKLRLQIMGLEMCIRDRISPARQAERQISPSWYCSNNCLSTRGLE